MNLSFYVDLGTYILSAMDDSEKKKVLDWVWKVMKSCK